ncbi:S1 family peptidase [Nostoc sp. LEGE 12450]|uniref:S1 family peptidase n=1 Tax=Nostoc sp. LEGE 12450 TaxID=1828643 RepID=UPI00187DEC1B|nr:serine protease [Nostoc sp. LEGE 12450]MBE8990192.1 trypsin-like peptidase domain-containing protein [Nostoc sp. LEGE 12450]
MDWRLMMLIACIGSLSILPLGSKPNVRALDTKSSTQGSAKQVQQLAELIAVKVLSKDFLGSGILIHRKGSVYQVLTNAHVLRSGNAPYQIQTPDGLIYAANLSKMSVGVARRRHRSVPSYFKGNDLAVLQFRSPKISYTVASLGHASTLSVGNEVFAAGFPFDSQGIQDTGFVFRRGQVSLVLDKALEGGYRIGYTNDIVKGMSGGPLLNRAGQVVAINGRHAEPLWGEPYIYQDGTQLEPPLLKQMSKYSWGIPIEEFIQMGSPSLTNNYSDTDIQAEVRR